METWKPIKGFDLYEVSDLGRIRNAKTGQILKLNYNLPPKNYTYVSLRRNGEYKGVGVARIVYMTFHNAEISTHSHRLRFKDGNGRNCALDNIEYLEAVTPKMLEDRRLREQGKLERAKTVKRLLQQGVTQAEIARRVGLTEGMITRIKKGERRKDAQP